MYRFLTLPLRFAMPLLRRALLAVLLPVLLGVLLGAPLTALLAGCSLRYWEGEDLEALGRWEEAMLAYHDAVIDFPGDEEYRLALQRAEAVVARDNFERYKTFLAQKSFRKAYLRLQDSARQDPSYAPAQAELLKWDRVLVGGQVHFSFETSQSNITLADEISLVVRLNTPNAGETLDAEIDIDTGMFFSEDLLYDRPNELLALYTINSIGVDLVYGRTRIKQFTSREFQRFVTIRTPFLDDISGTLAVQANREPQPVDRHRTALPDVLIPSEPAIPAPNPRYALTIRGDSIFVSTPDGTARTDFTPRFLYVNKKDRRVFVDFGRYEVKLASQGERWTLRRLPLSDQDYFPAFSRNIALKPYFFYREGVFTYLPTRSG